MRSCFALCFLLLAVNLANCSPIPEEELTYDDDFASIEADSNESQTKQYQKVIDLARALLDRLRSDGKKDDANKLLSLIQCAVDHLRAFASINPGRDMAWNIKGILDSVKSAQDRLTNMMRDLKRSNHYTD